MKRGKKLILLLGVLVLAIVGYVIATHIAANRPEEDPLEGTSVESDPIYEGYGNILDYDEADIVSIHIENDQDDFTIRAVEDNETDPGFDWEIVGHEDWILNHTSVSNTVEIAYSLFANRMADEDAVANERNLEDFGLADPAAALTVTFKDDASETIRVGNMTTDGNYFYGMVDGDDAIYTLGRNAGNTADFTAQSLRYLRPLQIFKDNSELYYLLIENSTGRNTEINYLGLHDETGETLEYYNAGTMKLSTGGDFAYDTQLFVAGGIQDIFQTMPQYIAPTEQIEDHAKDLDAYGLGDKPVHHVVLTYRVEVDQEDIDEALENGVDFDMDNVVYDEEMDTTYAYVTNEYFFGNEYTDEDGNAMVYFRYADSEDVLGVDRTSVNQFDFEPYIYTRRVLYMNSIDNVESMQVTIADQVYDFEFKRGEVTVDEEGNESQDVVYKINGQLIDESLFKKTYQSLIGVMSDYEIYGEKPGYDKSDIFTIDYVFTDGSTHSITYYRMNDYYYITQVGDDTWFACSYMQFSEIEDYLAQCLNQG